MTDQEYQTLKAFMAATWRKAMAGAHAPPPGMDPVSVLEKIEQTHPAQARAGLKQAVNDILAQILLWNPEQIKELDSALMEADIMTVSAALFNYSKRISVILKRGSIKNETEYYLIKHIADGPAEFSAKEDRERAIALANDFESSLRPKR